MDILLRIGAGIVVFALFIPLVVSLFNGDETRPDDPLWFRIIFSYYPKAVLFIVSLAAILGATYLAGAVVLGDFNV